jgi:tetratricopeptide (TPR) repeat protein
MPIWSAEIKELEKLYFSLKGQLPDLEKELERLIKADDENMILLYSRRCLEVIITDLCECELKRDRGSEPLKGILDKLHKERKVPAHIITSMHGLNELSTYGTHPKDFDPEQVKPVLNNLDIIIKWYLKYKNIVTVDKTEVDEEKTQLKKEPLEEVSIKERTEVQKKPAKAGERKLIYIVAISAILVISAIIAYPNIFKRNTIEKLISSGEKISVAVMPFQNMTNDTLWNIWQDGIQDILISSLSNSQELKIRQAEYINRLVESQGIVNYASITPSVASTISKKLNANLMIKGNIKQAGNIIRLYAQLIDPETEEVFKSFQIEGGCKEENMFHLIDSLSLIVKNFLIISELEKDIPVYYKQLVSTNSPDAYRYFVQGRNEYAKWDYLTAINLFSKALAIDSNFIQAINLTSLAYGNQFEYETMYSSAFESLYLYDLAKKWCLKAYEKMDQMTVHQKNSTNWIYANYFGTPNDQIKYLRQLTESDDQSVTAYFNLGNAYNSLFQYDKAIPEYEKALEIYKNWDVKPFWVFDYAYLGDSYHNTGQYRKEVKLYKKAEQDFPDNPQLTGRQAILSLTIGDTVAANGYLKKFIAYAKGMSLPEAYIEALLADVYNEAGVLARAEEYYRQAFSLDSANSDRINDLAYFLIDKDRNINEGLELVDRKLVLSPGDFFLLDTKGFGLYKQGKYQEALKIFNNSWDIRREKAKYDHEAVLHLEAAKKAVANQKNN